MDRIAKHRFFNDALMAAQESEEEGEDFLANLIAEFSNTTYDTAHLYENVEYDIAPRRSLRTRPNISYVPFLNRVERKKRRKRIHRGLGVHYSNLFSSVHSHLDKIVSRIRR